MPSHRNHDHNGFPKYLRIRTGSNIQVFRAYVTSGCAGYAKQNRIFNMSRGWQSCIARACRALLFPCYLDIECSVPTSFWSYQTSIGTFGTSRFMTSERSFIVTRECRQRNCGGSTRPFGSPRTSVGARIRSWLARDIAVRLPRLELTTGVGGSGAVPHGMSDGFEV